MARVKFIIEYPNGDEIEGLAIMDMEWSDMGTAIVLSNVEITATHQCRVGE
jgi:hypothetical protein